MPQFSPLIDELITAFKCLPGIGAKSAQRMVFNLLQRNRSGGKVLSAALAKAMDQVKNCNQCRNLSETALCTLCSHPNRNSKLLCVVETPADVALIEQAGGFRGLYFVLMGHLSPIDGIGPEDIGIELFQQRLQSGAIEEVIMATSTTVEGEATAFYLAEIANKHQVKTSRIAHGVPLGGELEHLDGHTIARALMSRNELVTSLES